MSTKPTTERQLLEQARDALDRYLTEDRIAQGFGHGIITTVRGAEAERVVAAIDAHLSKASPMNEDDAAFARLHQDPRATWLNNWAATIKGASSAGEMKAHLRVAVAEAMKWEDYDAAQQLIGRFLPM